MSSALPLIPGPVNPACGRRSTIRGVPTQSIYSLLEDLAPALKGIATKLVLSVSLQKAIHCCSESAASG